MRDGASSPEDIKVVLGQSAYPGEIALQTVSSNPGACLTRQQYPIHPAAVNVIIVQAPNVIQVNAFAEGGHLPRTINHGMDVACE
jgi:hypothetical protein